MTISATLHGATNSNISGDIVLPYVTQLSNYTGDRHPYVGQPALSEMVIINQINLAPLTVPATEIAGVTIQS